MIGMTVTGKLPKSDDFAKSHQCAPIKSNIQNQELVLDYNTQNSIIFFEL